jgi:multiple sugar transport system substrate-binding protein
MARWPETHDKLVGLLNEFEQVSGVKVSLRTLDWATGRHELIKIALDRGGADLSEIGTTWLSNLAGLGAIHAIESSEAAVIGLPHLFYPIAVKNASLAGRSEVLAVPWLMESTLIVFRKDLLDRAGLDPGKVFSGLTTIKEAALQLSRIGVPVPFGFPGPEAKGAMLQCLSTWIWQTGLDFVDEFGRRLMIDQRPIIEAVIDFFQFLKFSSRQGKESLKNGLYQSFHKGYVAIGIGDLWLYHITPGFTIPEVAQNLHPYPIPGRAFIGGSNLIIWKHTRQERAVLELVKFLTSRIFQSNYTAHLDMASPRIDLFEGSEDVSIQVPFQSTLKQALQTCKSLPNIPLWGLIEERLTEALINIWWAIINSPDLNLERLVSESFSQVSHNLNTILDHKSS